MQGALIEQLLGGTEVIGHTIRNEMDLYELSRSGLPKEALLNLIQNLGFTVKSMASLLHVTERTIQRKSDRDLLDLITSEQILQVADAYSRGSAVFGSQENFQKWIALENKMKVYRIAKKDFVGDLTGEGARLFGGRWNKKGMRVLYTSKSRSLATVEYLVHVSRRLNCQIRNLKRSIRGDYPAHKQFHKVKIISREEYSFDSRLLAR